ncbi:PD-(D/E)XK nuclease family protein [bacterium]|nr:PD-(D/E)XK nuclease family protein [bacterium]
MWRWVKCPIKGRVTWAECLACKNPTENCFDVELRELLIPRATIPNVYHVTELANPRFSFFERTHDYALSLHDKADLLVGKLMHIAIQQYYGSAYSEVPVMKDFGDFKVVGSIDVLDLRRGRIIELKTYATLKYKLEADRPEPDHEFQIQCYYALLKETQPWIVPEIKSLEIHYIAKVRNHGLPRFKRFKVQPKPGMINEIYSRARILHEALKRNVPPAHKCTPWLCKFCPHVKICARWIQ